jgi:hypothetical protein
MEMSRVSDDKSIFDRLYQKEHKVFHNSADPQLTFKPRIKEKRIRDKELAKLAAMPLDERFNHLYAKGVEQRLKKRNLPKDEMAALERKREEKELEECTFAPMTTWKKVFAHLEQDDEIDYVGNIGVMDGEVEHEVELEGEFEQEYVVAEEGQEETGVTTILGDLDEGEQQEQPAAEGYAEYAEVPAGQEYEDQGQGQEQYYAEEQYVAEEQYTEGEYAGEQYTEGEYAGEQYTEEQYAEPADTRTSRLGSVATQESGAFSLGLDDEQFEFGEVEAANEEAQQALGIVQEVAEDALPPPPSDAAAVAAAATTPPAAPDENPMGLF